MKVRAILADHESARNNDGTLFAYFIQKHCKDLVMKLEDGTEVIPLKNFKKLPPMENLRRVRQIIQNENEMYEPTDPEVRLRGWKICMTNRIKEQNMCLMSNRVIGWMATTKPSPP